MQQVTRSEPRLGVHIQGTGPQDASVGDLVSQLAQEGKDLAVVELRRLRVEMRQQARRAATTAAAGYLAIEFITLASLAVSVGVFLVLADAWDSYAAAAFATSALLAVVALAAGMLVRAMMKRMAGEDTDDHQEWRSQRGA